MASTDELELDIDNENESDIETVDPETLAGFEGQKVTLRLIDDNSPDGISQVQGLVDTANPLGLLFRERGKSKLQLIEPDEIVSIEPIESGPKRLRAKLLKPVTLEQARSHLLERHGWTLSRVNELTDADALRFHGAIDHVKEGLGHTHGVKEKKVVATEGAEDGDASPSEGGE